MIETSLRDRKRVLLVDDHDDYNLAFFADYLESKGYEVIVGKYGRKALTASEQYLPDAIICKELIGQKGSVSLVYKIKQNECTRRIPVLFLTTSDSHHHRVEALNLGAEIVVDWPIGVYELWAQLEALVRQAHLVYTVVKPLPYLVTSHQIADDKSSVPALVVCVSDWDREALAAGYGNAIPLSSSNTSSDRANRDTSSNTGFYNTYKDEVAASFLKHLPPADDSLENIFADLEALVGLARAKQQLRCLVNLLRVQSERKARGFKTVNTSLHLVLYGPPGTGKTTFARLLGRVYKQVGYLQQGHVVETDRAGIIGYYTGHTALRVHNAVEEALDGVLFIDEAYALIPKDGNSRDTGHEAVQVLLKRMEDHRDRLAVIVAGYPDEMERFIQLNPGLQSRFSKSFYFDHYNSEDLGKIFTKFCDEYGYTMDYLARNAIQKIFQAACDKRNKSFGNGRFVRTVFERSIEQQANRIAKNCLKEIDDSAISKITVEDLDTISYDTIAIL